MHTQQFKNKKRNTMQCLLALMLIGAASASFAAPPAPISITVGGTIKPGSCTPALDNNGNFAFPDILTGALDDNSYTKLTPITTTLKVTCTGTSTFFITTTDGAASSVLSDAIQTAGWGTGEAYGLGFSSADPNTQKKIGAYALSVGTATVDSNATSSQAIVSTDNGRSWSALGANGNITPSTKITWATPGATTLSPATFKSLTSTMTVNAILNKGTELVINNDTPLSGKATLQFSYL